MTKQPRWMKSILATAESAKVTLPFARGTRRRPAGLKIAPPANKAQGVAAR